MPPKTRIRLTFLTAAELAALPEYSFTTPTLSYSPSTKLTLGCKRWKHEHGGRWWLGQWTLVGPARDDYEGAHYQSSYQLVVIRPQN